MSYLGDVNLKRNNKIQFISWVTVRHSCTSDDSFYPPPLRSFPFYKKILKVQEQLFIFRHPVTIHNFRNLE
jgi:hypothetical protein